MRAFLLVLTIAAAGCYSPSIQPCELACSGTTCPAGLACNGQGMCAQTPTAMCGGAVIDAIGNEITVKVLDPTGRPLAAAIVVFADATGALVAEIPTGGDGRASVEMSAGGSATVIRAVPGVMGGIDYHVSTYLDLWIGAQVISQFVPNPATRQVMVNWSGLPTGYDRITVYASCGVVQSASGSPAVINIPERCPTFDILVTANSSSGLAPLHASLAAQTGAATLPGQWKSFRALPATLTGLPTNHNGTSANVGGVLTADLPSFGPFAFSSVDAAGKVVPEWQVPEVPFAPQSTFVRLDDPTMPNAISRVTVYDRLPASAATYQRDFNGMILPWLGNPTFDLVSRRMAWATIVPVGVTPATGSVVSASVIYHQGNSTTSWRLIVPDSKLLDLGAGIRAVFFPDVPGVHAFEPIAGATLLTDHVVQRHTEAEAMRRLIELLEPGVTDLDFFEIPTLRHVTVSLAPGPNGVSN